MGSECPWVGRRLGIWGLNWLRELERISDHVICTIVFHSVLLAPVGIHIFASDLISVVRLRTRFIVTNFRDKNTCLWSKLESEEIKRPKEVPGFSEPPILVGLLI